ncbi:MAG: hypothetical protein KGD60_14335 [Candidatus Thorarchaeota archaeon]|nr:hypothetical protein [Candidatus Thorarchaeota archaeon]
MSTHTVTKAVVEDLKYAFRRRWNVTAIVVGGPGEGKSRAVFTLSKIWVQLTGGEFHYCWDIDQIPDVQDGDWLHIDEWFVPEGQGKVIALQRLKHLFDTGRAKMICISVSTPSTPRISDCTFEITSLAQDFDGRRNLFEVRVPIPSDNPHYNRRGVYIGNVILPLGKDTERWLTYEDESYVRKTKLWKKKGKKTVDFNLDPQEIAKEVWKWAKERDLSIDTKSMALTFLRTLGRERDWDLTYSNEPEISNWIMTIKKQETPDSSDTGKKFGEFSEDWKGLREFIEEWCLGQKPARKEYATGAALWIVPEDPPLSQDDVFDLIDLGDNPVKVGTLTREIRNLRKRIQRPDRRFTDFTESWVASQLDTLGARKLGGPSAADVVLEGGAEVAVKFCVRNDPFYDYTVAPEKDGAVVIVIPRQLQFFVIPIAGNVVNEHLQLDNVRVRAGGVLVGIEELAATVKKMIEEQEDES